MKNLMIDLGIILFTGGASAETICPILSGSYHCTFERTGPQNLVISQKVVEGVTFFKFNGNEIMADGVVRSMPGNEELKDGFYQAMCSPHKLQIWQRANLTFAQGHLESTLTLFLESSGDLVNENRGRMIIDGEDRNLDNRGFALVDSLA